MLERRVFSCLLMVMATGSGLRGLKMVDVNEGVAGQPVALVVGDKVRVTLRETGGTGYRWRVGNGCEAVLRLDKDETEQPEERPGASVRRSWVYTAREQGRCELRFESARSWEKTVTGKVVVFPVTVGR